MVESFSRILLPQHDTLTRIDTPTLVLPFYLLTILYLNLTIPSSHYSFYFNSSSPHVFYYKYLLFSLPFYLYVSHKIGEYSLSLSLSLGEFLILCCTSNLGWWIFLLNSSLGWSIWLYFNLLSFFFFFFFFNSHIWMTLT